MNYISWHASCQCIASQLPDHLLVPDPVNTSAVTGQSVSFLSVEDAARTLQGEGVSHSGPSVLSCLFPQCDVQEYGRPSVSFSSTPMGSFLLVELAYNECLSPYFSEHPHYPLGYSYTLSILASGKTLFQTLGCLASVLEMQLFSVPAIPIFFRVTEPPIGHSSIAS